MLPTTLDNRVAIELEAVCHDCKQHHRIHETPLTWLNRMSEWQAKHNGHDIEFFSNRRRVPKGIDHREYDHAGQGPWWLDYSENTDIKIAYAASTAMTITLASLNGSSTLLTGRESNYVDNKTSVKYLDYYLSGYFLTIVTNLQNGSIITSVVGAIDDTPTWPDAFGGADASRTVTAQGVFDQVCRIVSSIAAAGAAQTWTFGPTGIASLFGGLVPTHWSAFVTHSAQTSGTAWSATGSAHKLTYTGVYATA